MRTIAWEIAAQIALRNCSEEVGVESVFMWFWWRGNACNQACIFCRFLRVMRNSHHHKDFSAFLDRRRYKNWAHKISSWEYLSEDLSCQFSQSSECLIPGHHAELLQGVLKVSSCSMWSNHCRGTWQEPICSWQLLCKLAALTCFNQHLVAKSRQTYFGSFLYQKLLLGGNIVKCSG